MEIYSTQISLLLVVVVGFLGYSLARELYIQSINRRKAAKLGCHDAPRLQAWDPIFGIDILITGMAALRLHNLLKFYDSKFQQCGNTVDVKVLNLPRISTADPENIKMVLAKGFEDFGLGPRRAHFLGPLVGHGIFTTEGAPWKRSRQLLRPNLTKHQDLNLPMFESHIHHLLALVPKDGQTVDLQELFCRLTIDSGTELLFGTSCGSLLEDENIDANLSFSKALDTAQSEMIIRDILGPFLSRFRSEKRFRDSLKSVHDFIDLYVQKAMTYVKSLEEVDPSEKRYIFLEELAKYSTDPLVLRWESINVLIAGRDTTAVLLGNTWWVLARRPDIWAKLKSEVEVLEGKPPTYEQLKELKYVRWLLSESLRLYPVLPINARTANKDTTLPTGGGPDGKSPIFVPKGSEVAWNTWTMHRRKDLYGDDAEEFIPERWEHLRPTWEYLPFNGGPRICLGRKSLGFFRAQYFAAINSLTHTQNNTH